MADNLKDIYYAGLIDGEGYVGLTKNKLGPKRKALLPIIVVGMTCFTTINSIKEHFNCGDISTRSPSKWGKLPSYYWRVTHKNAREVAAKIYPYSITKKENLKQILEYIPRLPGNQKDSKRGKYKK